MSETSNYISTLQKRIANQRVELENLHRIIDRDNSLIQILKDANQREYRLGYEAAIEEFAIKLENYYNILGGNTYSPLVAFHIEEIKRELKERL